MNDEVLIATLNRLENKVDSLSMGLATNTTVTKSHTDMLGDMKNVHDLNAKVILETRDKVKELDNKLMRIESWKNGQTEYQQQTMQDIKNIHERLLPIEKDFQGRSDKKKDIEKRWSDILWKSVERVALIVGGAVLISWREIFK